MASFLIKDLVHPIPDENRDPSSILADEDTVVNHVKSEFGLTGIRLRWTPQPRIFHKEVGRVQNSSDSMWNKRQINLQSDACDRSGSSVTYRDARYRQCIITRWRSVKAMANLLSSILEGYTPNRAAPSFPYRTTLADRACTYHLHPGSRHVRWVCSCKKIRAVSRRFVLASCVSPLGAPSHSPRNVGRVIPLRRRDGFHLHCLDFDDFRKVEINPKVTLAHQVPSRLSIVMVRGK